MSDRERSRSRNGSRDIERIERERERDRDRSMKEKSRHSRSRSRSPRHKKPASPYYNVPAGSPKNERGRHRWSRSRSNSYGGKAEAGPRESAWKRYSRSRSRSYSPHNNYRRSSQSRSPMSNRKRHVGDRENPTQSRCLGVFGLCIYTTEQQIHHIFSKYGPVDKVQVVIDAKTGRSRGFCFVYFENADDAKAAKNECTGMEIGGRRIRVDYSITQRAHTPTPGVYMGRPTLDGHREGGHREDRYRDRDRRRDRDDYRYSSRGYSSREYRDSRRSNSPHYRSSRRSRYERSRSRSYSPRR